MHPCRRVARGPHHRILCPTQSWPRRACAQALVDRGYLPCASVVFNASNSVRPAIDSQLPISRGKSWPRSAEAVGRICCCCCCPYSGRQIRRVARRRLVHQRYGRDHKRAERPRELGLLKPGRIAPPRNKRTDLPPWVHSRRVSARENIQRTKSRRQLESASDLVCRFDMHRNAESGRWHDAGQDSC